MNDREHGTYSTAQWHLKSGNLPLCEPCRRAKAEYTAQWRANPENRRRDREAQRAQSKASTKLRQAHPEEYQRYYTEALGEIRRPNRKAAA